MQILRRKWKFWRDYRVRDPKDVVDEIEDLVNNHGVGFFILADEEPTINKKKFVDFCQDLSDRGLPDKIKWGINTRVTDIYRDKDPLKFYRKAVSLPFSRPGLGARSMIWARSAIPGRNPRTSWTFISTKHAPLPKRIWKTGKPLPTRQLSGAKRCARKVKSAPWSASRRSSY